ncbi:hypothetical protein KVR01_011775 [Diaporthe batatas]|uniref:uncharacterized protein n=1 Tax=Diaporthe batatas TaxID=748121 RepID=UPI001D039887|nr:uncharacterized protein KVR01_011775 [Diaporthe batatas]KAG8158653.1 hypothetical protein KVR01_011775 [Diaporthe batatas]
MTNILSLPHAEFTYAQIVDGMPTSDIYRSDHWYYEHNVALPVDHQHLCPGIMKKTQAFRAEFDIMSLRFDTKTIDAYQGTVVGTVAYQLRLLELVVIACHDIAGFLYQMDDGAHKHAEFETWHAEKLESLTRTIENPTQLRIQRSKYGPPTPFYRGGCWAWKRYPNGLADVAGYWAEYHIFGGTVLFDRGETEEECNGIYIYGTGDVFTIAPPSEKQFNELLDFILSPNPDHGRCPLPIRITKGNKWRWHPYDGMVKYHIYKFRHDVPEGARPRDHCVITTVDWPESADEDTILTQYERRLMGEGDPDEDLIRTCRERLKRTTTPTSRCYHWNEEEQAKLQPDPKKRGRPPYFFDP